MRRSVQLREQSGIIVLVDRSQVGICTVVTLKCLYLPSAHGTAFAFV